MPLPPLPPSTVSGGAAAVSPPASAHSLAHAPQPSSHHPHSHSYSNSLSHAHPVASPPPPLLPLAPPAAFAPDDDPPSVGFAAAPLWRLPPPLAPVASPAVLSHPPLVHDPWTPASMWRPPITIALPAVAPVAHHPHHLRHRHHSLPATHHHHPHLHPHPQLAHVATPPALPPPPPPPPPAPAPHHSNPPHLLAKPPPRRTHPPNRPHQPASSPRPRRRAPRTTVSYLDRPKSGTNQQQQQQPPPQQQQQRSNRPSSAHANAVSPPTSVREFNRTISACARRRDLAGALRALAQLDAAPNLSRNLFTYNAVINALVMCAQHASADTVWHEMLTSGISPNLVTFNTMLKSCFGGTDHDVDRAFRLLQEMEQRAIAPDRVTLNSLINACVSAGRVRDAQRVYEQMRSLNIEPDAYTFCTLAKQARHQCDVSMLDALLLHQLHHHTAVRRRDDAAVALASPGESDAVHGVSPVAYNTIADAYIRCGYPERAIALLERMQPLHSSQDDGPKLLSSASDPIPVAPDVQTFNVRLKALRESGAPASDAFAALDEMGALGLEADHITLLTLADLCCRREDMSSAEGVLRAATMADIREHQRGSQEWKTLCQMKSVEARTAVDVSSAAAVGGAAQAGRAMMATVVPSSQQAVVAVTSAATATIVQNNGRRNANQPRNAKANAALFNALIRGYSSLDPPDMDRAVALYKEMRSYVDQYGFCWYAPDSVTYTMLVDGFARVSDSERAELIVGEMETAGRANVVAYNAYLKANRGNGFTAALGILERMKNAGLRPDVVTYNTVIDFLSSEDNGTQIAEDLVLVDMPRNGVRADLLTFNTLIKGVARNRGNKTDAGTALSSAYRWLNELQSRGLKPDEFTYQSMVSACAAAGDAPRALEFFRKVEAERAKRVKSAGRLNGFSSGSQSSGSRSGGSGASSGSSTPGSSRHGASSNFSRGTGFRRRTANGGSSPLQNSADWMLLPHPAAYVALMRAFLSSGAKDGVDSVLLLRDEMVARGLELGRTGYTAVADAYAQRADIASVEATFKEMLVQETDPTQKLSAVHHCIRMKALCNAGRLDDAIAILDEVENADTAVFNVLIFACAKTKDMDRLEDVLNTMQALQIQPDAITARAMSTMMRSVARTLKSFDSRFHNSVVSYVDKMSLHSADRGGGSGSSSGSGSGSEPTNLQDERGGVTSDGAIWSADGVAGLNFGVSGANECV